MIHFKKVTIVPEIIPTHTYLFLRCLEYEYGKAFLERGSMRFANPSEWCKSDGTSRGDILEGVYASQRGFDPTLDGLLKSLRRDPITLKDDVFTFYKSNEILSQRAHCLYGLNNTNMNLQENRSQDHRYHQAGKVTKEYFRNLFPKVKEEDIATLEPEKRPAVLIIRPDLFVAFVMNGLMARGVKEEEILIRPVSYVDYYREPFIIWREPEELFSKSINYSEQCEIRIVVDTRRKEVDDLFDENGVIELGPVDNSIATLSEFYFEDMLLEIRENENKILYTLAKPIEYKIDEVDDVSLIIVFQQALSDELPGAPMSIDTIEKKMGEILHILQQRDPNVWYDKKSNHFCFKGIECDLGQEAARKMLEHYNNYVIDRDFKTAGEIVEKFKYFFPKYDMGNYFKAYFDWLKSFGKRPF